jgi:hypothetical protein
MRRVTSRRDAIRIDSIRIARRARRAVDDAVDERDGATRSIDGTTRDARRRVDESARRSIDRSIDRSIILRTESSGWGRGGARDGRRRR